MRLVDQNGARRDNRHLTLATAFSMTNESSVFGFEIETPMVVEIISLLTSNLPVLRLRLALSLAPTKTGHEFRHDYDIEIVSETFKTLLPVEVKNAHSIVENALNDGRSPMKALFEADSALLDRIQPIEPGMHASLSNQPLGQATLQSALPPSKGKGRI